LLDNGYNNGLSEDVYKTSSRLLMNHAEMEYSELCETWRDLERKAQGTIAIAGIFAAGIVGVLRLSSVPDGLLMVFLVLSFLCLIISIIQAILTLFVSEVICIECSVDVIDDAESIFLSGDDEEAKGCIRRFVMNRLVHWKDAIESLDSANRKKAGSLELAQRFLLASVVFYAFVFLEGVVNI